MQKHLLVSIVVTFIALQTASAGKHQCHYQHRTIDALVSTEWLDSHRADENLVIVDLRTSDLYLAGHIPGAVQSLVSSWWVARNDLLLELPDVANLRTMIGKLGINASNKVVLVNQVDTDYDRAQLTRVAWTMIYAGLKNVALLNGGINQWITEERELSTIAEQPIPVNYTGSFDYSLVVPKEYVYHHLRYATIIDARIPEDFFGVTTPRMFAEKDGHIAGAQCLPTPWVFSSNGAFKNIDTLEAMAYGSIGNRYYKNNNIIIYCGVGGFASTWWFLLSEVFGLRNVSVYDGSIQEWTRDPYAPVEKFSW